MGRSRVMGTHGGKAASASEVGGSTRKRKAASASETGDSSLKGKQVSTSEDRKILRLKKEEDRLIRRVKSEEGKILKLKKVANAANDEAMAKLPPAYRPKPTVKAAELAGKKKKKVLVKRLVPQDQIDALLAMPCPITPNELTEEELGRRSPSFQDLYNQEMDIAKKLRDYHQALIYQYSKYGFAVDESEAEVTDDEDGDGPDAEVTVDEGGDGDGDDDNEDGDGPKVEAVVDEAGDGDGDDDN